MILSDFLLRQAHVSLDEVVMTLEEVLRGGELLEARSRDQLDRRVLNDLLLALLVLVNLHVVHGVGDV